MAGAVTTERGVLGVAPVIEGVATWGEGGVSNPRAKASSRGEVKDEGGGVDERLAFVEEAGGGGAD